MILNLERKVEIDPGDRFLLVVMLIPLGIVMLASIYLLPEIVRQLGLPDEIMPLLYFVFASCALFFFGFSLIFLFKTRR